MSNTETPFAFTLNQTPPDTGSIAVTSTPSGAKIFLDGADTTKVTPFTLLNIPVGNHAVYVTLSGYDTPAPVTKAVTKNAETPFAFTLNQTPPDTGSISVTSTPSGAKIFLDGADTTKVTPFTLLNIPVGNHAVYVTLSGYDTPAPVTKAVTKNTVTPFAFTLNQTPPDTGSISVTSTPSGAKIFLDGADTAKVTPFTLLNIPVGNHAVYVTLSGYDTPAPVTKAVTKNAVTTFAIHPDADPSGYREHSVTSTPSGAKIFLDGADTTKVTPFTLLNIPVGNHAVYVTLSGYDTPAPVTKAVTKNTVTSYSFTLTQTPADTGSISVTSTPAGAKIFLDGADTAKVTPFTLLNIPVGNHAVYVTLSGYDTPAPVTKAVTKNAVTSYSFTLTQTPADTGSISVTSTPAGAKIFLDGADTTKVTPFTLPNIPVGNHAVYVTLSGYDTPAPVTKVVTKNAVTSYSFTLTQVPPDTNKITVVSPNGGETWKVATSELIKWSYSGNPGAYVDIELIRGTYPVLKIASNVPIGSNGVGSYSWNIPADKPTDSNYMVRILRHISAHRCRYQ